MIPSEAQIDRLVQAYPGTALAALGLLDAIREWEAYAAQFEDAA